MDGDEDEDENEDEDEDEDDDSDGDTDADDGEDGLVPRQQCSLESGRRQTFPFLSYLLYQDQDQVGFEFIISLVGHKYETWTLKINVGPLSQISITPTSSSTPKRASKQ